MDAESEKQLDRLNLVEASTPNDGEGPHGTPEVETPCDSPAETPVSKNELSGQAPNEMSRSMNLDGCESKQSPSQDEALHNIMHSLKSAGCAESWESMPGNDCIRTCARCNYPVIKPKDASIESLYELWNTAVKGQSRFKLPLYRRFDGTYVLANCYIKNKHPNMAMALQAFVLGLLPQTAMYLLAPGFTLPFLNHPVGRLMFCVTFLIYIFGAFLLSKTKNSVLIVLISLFFGIPFILFPMLGPAAVTIMMAFQLAQ